jgi:hypothetical protein
VVSVRLLLVGKIKLEIRVMSYEHTPYAKCRLSATNENIMANGLFAPMRQI